MGEKMLIILAQEIIFLLSPDAKNRDDNDGNDDDDDNDVKIVSTRVLLILTKN